MPFAGSLSVKDRWLSCTESIYILQLSHLRVPELLNVAQSGEERLGLVISVPTESIRCVVEVSVPGVVREDFPPASTDGGGGAAAAVATGAEGFLHHQIII